MAGEAGDKGGAGLAAAVGGSDDRCCSLFFLGLQAGKRKKNKNNGIKTELNRGIFLLLYEVSATSKNKKG